MNTPMAMTITRMTIVEELMKFVSVLDLIRGERQSTATGHPRPALAAAP